RPSLRESDFDTERNVILEEIAMYQDIPYRRLYDEVSDRHYANHPLGYRVLGTPDSIRNLQRDAMASYFEKHYSAASTTIALAGRLDFDRTVEEIERLCGGWSTHRTEREYPSHTPESREYVEADSKVKRTYLLGLTPAPGLQDERRYAANMLAHLIGDQDGSLFYWALVDPGLAEEAQLSYNPHDGLGDFFIFAACSPDRADEVERVMDEQISACFDNIGDDDLDRYRNKIATGVTLAGERPAGRMHRLGRLWTAFGEYRTLDEELQRIQAVTLDDVRGVYDAFNGLNPRTIGRLTPARTTTASDENEDA
ncbi:MAG: M16 family metallopeptidase, partial [Planctomycetota bacterium]